MDYTIGLDLGTSAIKGVSLSLDGTLLRTAKRKITFLQSEFSDTKEIDSKTYIGQVLDVIRELVVPNQNWVAIAWVAASGNLMLLDNKGEPLCPIHSWLDQRPVTKKIGERMNDREKKEIYDLVGWPFSATFPLGRLMWISTYRQDLLDGCTDICMSNDYLGRTLSGVWALDESTATTMYLYDQRKGEKSRTLLERAAVSHLTIPPLQATGTVVGPILSSILKDVSAEEQNPQLVLGCFDHPGAARAVGLQSKNQFLISCGTSWVGCVLLENREEGLEKEMLIDPYTHAEGGGWLGMFSLTSIGQIFEEWADLLLKTLPEYPQNPLAFFDKMAAKASRDHTPRINMRQKPSSQTLRQLQNLFSDQEIARGILCSVVLTLQELMEQKRVDVSQLSEIFLVGGPTQSSLWPQIIADTFGLQVVIRFGLNAGAVGAGMLAAKGVGKEVRVLAEDIVIKPSNI